MPAFYRRARTARAARRIIVVDGYPDAARGLGLAACCRQSPPRISRMTRIKAGQDEAIIHIRVIREIRGKNLPRATARAG
jgi:hypothetical protein